MDSSSWDIWGELIPFCLDRLDEALPQAVTKLNRPISDYVHENVYITPSGMFSQAQFQFCFETIGVERILFSVDYPFIEHSIAHGNTEKLLGL